MQAKNSFVRLAIMYDQAFWQEPEPEERDEDGKPRPRPKAWKSANPLPEGKSIISPVDEKPLLDALEWAGDDEDAFDGLLSQMFKIQGT